MKGNRSSLFNMKGQYTVRSSNPVLKTLVKPDSREDQQGFYRGTAAAQQGFAREYGQSMMSGYAAGHPAERTITVDDVISKTGITLGVIVVMAIVNYGIGTVNQGLSSLLSIVGAVGGLVAVLISTFGRKFGSAAVTLTYAAFEGLFVGGISYLFANVVVSGHHAGALIGQAVLGTVGVFAGMLYVYKTGAVKVTPKFNRIVLGCLIGVVVLSLGNMLLYMFTGSNPLTDGGPLAIIFSLFCIGLAAVSFLQDFNVADQLVRAGAPATMAWGVALGLAVTLVWLYMEILRLLSYFRD